METNNVNITNETISESPIAEFSKVSFEQFKKDWIKTFKLDGELFDDTGIRYVYDNIELPRRKTKGSAGYDINIPYGIAIDRGMKHIIPTGIRCKMKQGWVAMIYPRSSMGIKHGMVICNTVPVVDSDYFFADNEGHIFLAVKSDTNILSFDKNEAIAQVVFVKYGTAIEEEVTELRTGGIGSTNKKQ